VWPAVPGLALASASQVYPRLLNGESIVGMAERVAGEVHERLNLRGGVPVEQPEAVASTA